MEDKRTDDKKFTLGTCNANGSDYEFRFDNGKYYIFKKIGEEFKEQSRYEDSREAYDSWNLIKRPERAKKR